MKTESSNDFIGLTPATLRISGSGLGLSICHEIVMAHGGQMWLEQPRSEMNLLMWLSNYSGYYNQPIARFNADPGLGFDLFASSWFMERFEP